MYELVCVRGAIGGQYRNVGNGAVGALFFKLKCVGKGSVGRFLRNDPRVVRLAVCHVTPEEEQKLLLQLGFEGNRGHIHRAGVGYVNGSETCRTDVKYHICGIDTFPARHNS